MRLILKVEVMKSTLVPGFLLLMMMFFACGENQTTEAEEEVAAEPVVDEWSPEEGSEAWMENWNNNDAAGVLALTTDDAILLIDGQANNRQEIETWTGENAPMMRNLRLEPFVQEKSEEIAYEAGTYTHNITNNDTLEIRGAYTLIWEKQDDEQWKLQVIMVDQAEQ